MRYFNFALKTSSTEIKEKAKVNLRDYGGPYESPVYSVNAYMFKNLKNSVSFLAYREEENRVFAAYVFDERKESDSEAYDYIMDMLGEAFLINKVVAEPEEITMYQFMDYFMEARRRELTNHMRLVDNTKLWIYEYRNEPKNLNYCFEEKIISDDEGTDCAIYDPAFVEELNNIELHENTSEHMANPVHYVLACRSVEAAGAMTQALMRKLLKAKRISGRRMEIISSITPEVTRGISHLEEMIENNYGGVIVFDLTERFGRKSTDYIGVVQYLENLLKKYRNQCLFVFTYNMDNPGFSYYLLPKLTKYVIPVKLKEGKGDRKAAIKYMKSLIKGSEYAQYAGQAGEYMKNYPGDEFTQTEVLDAFEKFETWCLNKNVLQAYNYDFSDTFMLERDEAAEPAYDRLQKLIGLSSVKKQIDRVIAAHLIEKERKKYKKKGKNKDDKVSCMHMIYAGNPGTAKTTVARLVAQICKDKGILKSGVCVEKSGMDLDRGIFSEFCVREAFTAAKGGILFVDEAYAISSDGAITALIQEMENHREDVIVVLAGYNKSMKNFLERNEGLKSRIPFWIDFPDYSAEELTDIFRLMLDEYGFTATEDAIKEALYRFERVRTLHNFGNGRYVRNLLEGAIKNQAERLISEGKDAADISKQELFLITADDVHKYKSDIREEEKADRKAGDASKELEEMIGLSSAKSVIHKAIKKSKLNRIYVDKGIKRSESSMHMVFTGNPGTAKTTVARLVAEIMKDEGVLKTGAFVEVGRADLVGGFEGSTAINVKKKFMEAEGGVLFIDEAYSLVEYWDNAFGDEAINTIVQEMENHRKDTVVIFAGYPEPMKSFLDRNPGMRSRIAFHVEFEDYSTEELLDITKLMLRRQGMSITDEALEKLKGLYELAKNRDGFGNGRFVRKLLEEAAMNLAERVLEFDEEELTPELITTIEVEDIPDSIGMPKEKARLGFAL